MSSCSFFRRVQDSFRFAALCSLGFAGLHLRAAPVVVGLVSFDNLIPGAPGAPGVNGFTIQNFTGSNTLPGTPDSPISFENAAVVLNGTQTVDVGTVDPGSVQPGALQFPDTQTFTEANFSATLSTLFFTITGQQYEASSNLLTADLIPSTPPDLAAGTDFVILTVDASPVVAAAAPEPGSLMLLAGGGVLWFTLFGCRATLRTRRSVNL
jgi:hypothetical protein